MNASADRLEFAPPATRGLGGALVLALLAHLLLLAALTLGVQWKRNAPVTTVEAELWSAVPRPAAPPPVEAAPVQPPPPPAPAPPAPPKEEPRAADADIALEREKQRLEQEKRLAAQQLEQQKRDREKLAQDKKREQELKLAQEQRQREEEIKRRYEQAKRQQAIKAAQEAAKAEREAAKARQAQQQAREQTARVEALRKDNLQRMAGLAGATGSPAATGSALRASGPSTTYAARLRASVKPNIVFTEDPADNPTALMEVRVAPDGTIVGRKLLKPSGNKAWDEAVLRAIDKTAVLPRDVDGTVPPVLLIDFKPRE